MIYHSIYVYLNISTVVNKSFIEHLSYKFSTFINFPSHLSLITSSYLYLSIYVTVYYFYHPYKASILYIVSNLLVVPIIITFPFSTKRFNNVVNVLTIALLYLIPFPLSYIIFSILSIIIIAY